jgi:hypothetical protein
MARGEKKGKCEAGATVRPLGARYQQIQVEEELKWLH